jgi:hypothetical protein
MLDERWQNEYPKICLRLLDLLRLKRPPPRCAQLVLKKYTSVCGVEVLGEFTCSATAFLFLESVTSKSIPVSFVGSQTRHLR